MLKKIITIGAIAGTMSGVLVGCSGEYQSMMNTEANEYKQHVDLADYKNIEVTKIDRSNENVTEEQVMETLNALKDESFSDAEITETGDTVTIATTATIDGEDFPDGTLSDFDYIIGSGQLVDGFDEGLVGKKANEEFEVKAKFPDDYGDERVNGKEGVFKVTISKIKRPDNSEINDEWVKNNAEDLKKKGYEAGTLDELKTAIRAQTIETAKVTNDQQVAAEAIEKVIKNSNFKSYPEEETKRYSENVVKNIKEDFTNYGSEFDSIEAYLKETYELANEAELETYATEQAQEYMKNKMVVTLIAAENGIEVSDEEVNKLGDQMALYYGYEDFSKMKEEYGDEVKDDFTYQTLWQKVGTYLASVSKEVNTSTELDTASETEITPNEQNTEVKSE